MNTESIIRGFDFHCHIDLHPNPAMLMKDCVQKKIVAVAVTTTPKAWPQNCMWAKNNNYVFIATGLHPEVVGKRHSEISLLEQQIAQSSFVGEIGLDGSNPNRGFMDEQKNIFRKSLICAQAIGGRVLSIHSRRASRDVINMIREHAASDRALCILHWFSGSIDEVAEAVEIGCYFSINHSMFVSESGCKLIASMPIDRLLTESDSPFTMVGERHSLPWDVINIIPRIAEIRGEPIQTVSDSLMKNAKRVFNFARVTLPE